MIDGWLAGHGRVMKVLILPYEYALQYGNVYAVQGWAYESGMSGSLVLSAFSGLQVFVK